MASPAERHSASLSLEGFSCKRKAQTEVMSIVLITGVILSLVSAAYFWGVPLIDKRTSVSSFTVAEQFVKDLDGRVVALANAGSGTFSLDVPQGSVIAVSEGASGPNNNSILLRYESGQPLALNATTVYLGGGSFKDVGSEVGAFGQAKPGVITLSSAGFAGSYVNTVRLRYRELDTDTAPGKGYKIALAAGKATGTGTVRVGFSKTETLAGAAANGGDLVKTTLTVDVS